MQEFEDHFDDEIDFTPPAEDTPSMQSPAEVYTLAVSPVALPGPPHLQPPGRITGRTHALSETLGQRHFVIINVIVTLIPCLFCFLIGLAEGSPEFQVARHNLSYIQEIGNGWFGQVLYIFNILLFPGLLQIFLDGPVVTPGRVFSVCVITGYFE